ncbi:hypothetical protein GCM10012279_18100 [Micromonospora yangpuensis]|nr:hypothetical protein GCM10012279_18100 [Micromonospora yangpuensis]
MPGPCRPANAAADRLVELGLPVLPGAVPASRLVALLRWRPAREPRRAREPGRVREPRPARESGRVPGGDPVGRAARSRW